MKKPRNNETKARLFGLYLGQNVLGIFFELKTFKGVVRNPYHDCDLHDASWLELKSLSNISDEDLKKLFITDIKNIEGVYMVRSDINSGIDNIENWYRLDLIHADYLRYKGYALPYMGIQVEEMIELGWIKLIEE